MRITAKLALSQLKINRSRTVGALTAVALSAALITAVCSFVASGSTMLVSFLGENYGEYGGTYKTLLLVPAVLFGLLIAAMSVTVISNVFRVSAGERVAQFGVLKCVGATEKQITESVMYESVLLSAAGIPIGLLLGLLLTYMGIGVANHYLGDLNSLVNVMIVEIHLTLEFIVSWKALLLSAALCLATVTISAWLPARKAAKLSAIDCIRKTGEVDANRDKRRIPALVQRIFGFEGVLAVKNLRRSRRNFRATVNALSIGVILFITLGALSKTAEGIENLMKLNVPETVIAEYSSAYGDDTPEGGAQYQKPIDSALGNELTNQLEEHVGTDVFGMGADRDRYSTDIESKFITDDVYTALEAEKNGAVTLPVEIITLDDENYKELCETAGAEAGAVILLDHYSYNDNGYLVHIVPFSRELKSLSLKMADGSGFGVEIGGVLTKEQIPSELFYVNTNPVRLVLPRAEVRGYSWMADPQDVSGFIAYAGEMLDTQFPEGKDGEYMEAGFSTRAYKINDYMRVMNIAIVLVSVFLYSFTALLMLIGITNVISTLSTNVLMRAREFAVLKSVGMTTEGLRRMLNLESVLCAGKALLYGLPTGILLGYLISIPIKAMYPIPYELPWLSALLCALAVLLATWGTTRCAQRRLKKQNLIETIRAESGM